MMARFSATLSGKIFWLLCMILVLMRFMFPRFGTHDVTAFISWDICSHYLWLPAFFIHDDLGLYNFEWIARILREYQPVIGYRQLIAETMDMGPVFSTTMGMSLLFAPFFIPAHLFAILAGLPADGFSIPYQLAIALGGLCWSALGIWYLRRVLLLFLPDRTTAFTMIVVVMTTGYLPLTSFNGGATENLLFTLYAILLFLSTRLIARPTYGTAVSIGIIAGFIFLVRPFDGILMVPWMTYLGYRLSGKHDHITAFGSLAFFFTSSLQLIYWKFYTGNFYFHPGAFLPVHLEGVVPYFALGAIPAGFLIQNMTSKKRVFRLSLLFAFCCIMGLNLFYTVRAQVVLNHYDRSPGRSFHRFDHKELIPVSERYTARVYPADETAVLDHPEWFKTRRIFSQKTPLVKLNDAYRFSPGINTPLAGFSDKSWIGLKARAMIWCSSTGTRHSGNVVITLLRDQKAVQWRGTRFDGNNLKPGQWNEFTLNYLIHDPRKNDILQAYVWYTGNDQILVGSYSVTLYEIQDDE